jgi:hypothetical protein
MWHPLSAKVGGRSVGIVRSRTQTTEFDKEELPDHWKESIIVPVHKKSDKTDSNNYRGISLLSTSYKILSNILLSRLTPCTDEIIGDHQCWFRSGVLHLSDNGGKVVVQ